jgi:aryl-alcohol dehydrogenase-like predicted oxidoreductase
MKLALGTAQFGLDYGISNSQGQVPYSQVKDILEHASALGINTLDCAGSYGNSEKVLGELPESGHFNIISKIPALTNNETSINKYLQRSLMHLQRDEIDVLLFHQADNLITHPKKKQLFKQLQILKSQNVVKKIGVSVYSPEQLQTVADNFSIEVAQVPINIFDQRFISKDIINLCQEKQIKLHARSLFLQGLLFIEQERLVSYFTPFKDKLKAFGQLAKHLNCSTLSLALAIVTQESFSHNNVIEQLVVGVCNVEQLTEIVDAYSQATTLNISKNELLILADSRVGFINPSMWSITDTKSSGEKNE